MEALGALSVCKDPNVELLCGVVVVVVKFRSPNLLKTDPAVVVVVVLVSFDGATLSLFS